MVKLVLFFACISVIVFTLGESIADHKDALEEGRSLGIGGIGYALLPLFMLGVRKYMLYRWLKTQKDGSGLSVNINAGDGYEFEAKINLKPREDKSFYEAQEYQGPEYYPSYPFKKTIFSKI